MSNFLFSNSAHIVSKIGFSGQLGVVMKRLGCRRVLVVTDENIERLGLMEDMISSLKREGLEWNIFKGVHEDPSASNVT